MSGPAACRRGSGRAAHRVDGHDGVKGSNPQPLPEERPPLASRHALVKRLAHPDHPEGAQVIPGADEAPEDREYDDPPGVAVGEVGAEEHAVEAHHERVVRVRADLGRDLGEESVRRDDDDRTRERAPRERVRPVRAHLLERVEDAAERRVEPAGATGQRERHAASAVHSEGLQASSDG